MFRIKGRNVLFSSINGAPKKAFLPIATCEELKKKEQTKNNEWRRENSTKRACGGELGHHKTLPHSSLRLILNGIFNILEIIEILRHEMTFPRSHIKWLGP